MDLESGFQRWKRGWFSNHYQTRLAQRQTAGNETSQPAGLTNERSVGIPDASADGRNRRRVSVRIADLSNYQDPRIRKRDRFQQLSADCGQTRRMFNS